MLLFTTWVIQQFAISVQSNLEYHNGSLESLSRGCVDTILFDAISYNVVRQERYFIKIKKSFAKRFVKLATPIIRRCNNYFQSCWVQLEAPLCKNNPLQLRLVTFLKCFYEPAPSGSLYLSASHRIHCNQSLFPSPQRTFHFIFDKIC